MCYCGLNVACYLNFMWKVLTASGHLHSCLNGVCYSEYYVDGTAQQVDSSTKD